MTNTFVKGVALDYARRGWPIFPCHNANGAKCSCGKDDCPSPAKHPRTVQGVRAATTDETQIQNWWNNYPQANVAIRTGAESGILVLDIDPRHGGNESLAKLGVDLSGVPSVKTGGGGRHYYFSAPKDPVKNRANIRPGIDIRGANGYVLAPPSDHISGGVYEWETDIPDALPPVPEWLSELLSKPERPEQHNAANVPQDAHQRLLRRATSYVAKCSPRERRRAE